MINTSIVYGEGWYSEESDGFSAFRWMSKRAVCTLKGYQVPGKKYLQITAAHSFPDDNVPVLEVSVNGQKKGEKEIPPFSFAYIFPFEEEGDLIFEFRLDRVFKISTDSRELGIMVREIKVVTLSELEEPLYGEGWYDWEYGDFFPFRWMSKKAEIFLPPKPGQADKYFSFFAYSEFTDFSQKLSLFLGEAKLGEFSLAKKWNYYSFSSDSQAGSQMIQKEKLTLSLNKIFPEKYHPGDSRQLGIRVGRIDFHDDDELHQNFLFFHRNASLNYREMQAGKTKLESFPLNLGIDLYAKCNIDPPCVYCLWERMKKLEGAQVNKVVDEKTLEGYGLFFKSARTLVNCSFGEPLLHPRLKEILELCQKNKKILEISTNGQGFTPRTIKALVGKSVYLYVSLDAASKETYAKIRNDSWDSIIPNLILLNEERKKAGSLPKIYLVFMPMKVNREELEAYFRLCQKIEADALVLRPLLYIWKPQIRVQRAGYLFDYEKELLSRQEIVEVIKKSEELSIKYRIPVANQFDFGVVQKARAEETYGGGNE